MNADVVLENSPLYCVLLYPYHGLVTSDTIITFRWSAADNEGLYRLKIATDSLFSTGNIVSDLLLPDTFITTTLPGYQYYFCQLTVYDENSGDSLQGSVIKYRVFNPNSLISLKGWYAADHSGGMNNIPLGTWPDQSNNNNIAQNTNPAQQPVYLINRINGKPSVRFDGVNDYLSCNVNTNSTVFDLFFLSSLGGVSGPYYNGNASINGYGLYRNDTNFYGSLLGGISFLKFGNVAVKGFQIQEFYNTGGQLSYYVNGGKSGNTLPFTPNAPNGGALIGAATTTATFRGELCELMIFNQNLSQNNKDLIFKYLHDKYGPPPVSFNKKVIIAETGQNIILKPTFSYTGYMWSTGDTTSSVTVTSTGWVTLLATDRFNVTSEDSVYVFFHPSFPNLKDTILCLGENLLLNADIGNNYSYYWESLTEDSLSMTAQLTVYLSGIYTVTIDNNSGFSFSSTVKIGMDSLASFVSLGNDTSMCSAQPIGLISAPPGELSYLWSTGSTDTVIIIDTSGIYSVRVEDIHQCKAVDSIHITVSNIAPQIDFIANNQCIGDSSLFDGLLLLPDTIIQWVWNFGDGNTDFVRNTHHHYSEPGQYEVSLSVTSQTGCLNSISKTIEIYPLPVITLALDSGCRGVDILFYANAVIESPDSAAIWDWDFGDNDTGTGEFLLHAYQLPGNYQVRVGITTLKGCMQTATDSVNIVGSSVLPSSLSLIYPYSGQVTSDTSLHFLWTKSANALEYKVEISLDSLFSPSGLLHSYKTSDTNLICNINPGGDLYWRVVAYNLCRDSVYSSHQCFMTFNPANYLSLKAWYAADKIPLQNGTNIQTWPDASGNLMTATNIISTKQPLLKQSSLNNKPVAVFDGIDDFLYTPIPFISTEFDLIVVTTLGLKVGPFYLGNANSNGYGFYRNDTNAYGALFGGMSFLTFGNGLRNGYQVQELRRNLDLTNYYVNNKISGLASITIPISPAGEGFLGAVNSNMTFKGDLAELLCFDQPLTESERQLVFKYLHDKYCPPPPELGNNRFSQYSLCPVVFDLPEVFQHYQWSDGNTTHQTEVQKTGWIKVTVEDIFEVITQDSIYIEYPVKSLKDTTICYGDSIILSVSNKSGYQYQWEYSGQGVISQDSAINVSGAGVYKVTISDTLGCYMTDSLTLTVDSFPIQASLGGATASLCQGDYLSLASGAAEATSYGWNTGSSEPQTLIQQAGLYSVTVTNSKGCEARDSIFVTLHGFVPIAEFTAQDSVCLGETVQFTDLSHPQQQDTTASIVQWEWIFNDTLSLQSQHPSFLFEEPGFHTVSLTITTDSGCVSSVAHEVYIHSLPQASFLTTQGCTGTPVPFADHSFYPTGKGKTWYWDFGDTASGLSNFSDDSATFHTYMNPGNYEVKLKVTTTTGCRDSLSRTVIIQQSPDLEFTYSKACEGDSTRFTNVTVLPPWSPVIGSEWNFGDGSAVSNEAHPSHLFPSAGSYWVSLTLQTMQCKVSKSMLVVVNAAPLVGASAADLCQGIPAVFTDLSTVAGGSISQWYWDLGPLGSSYEPDVNLLFADTGVFTIRHSVTSDQGCNSDTLEYTLEVFANPQAGFVFEIEPDLPLLTVTFTSACSPDVLSWQWDFGDGGTSFIQNPVHTYGVSGNYPVSLEVQNVHGCADTSLKMIELRPVVINLGVSRVYHLTDNGLLKFGADLINTGTRNISVIHLNLSVSGRPFVLEQWTGILQPDSLLHYDFYASVFEQPGMNIDYYCIEALIEGGLTDSDPDDNILCKSLEDIMLIPDPYPNPASEYLNIPIILPQQCNLEIELFNPLGQKVFQGVSQTGQKGLNLYTLSFTRQSPGIYTLRINVNGKLFYKKISLG